MSKQKTFTQLHVYGCVLLWWVSLGLIECVADAEQKPTSIENPASRKMHQVILRVQDRDVHVVGTHSFLSIGFGQPPPAYSI